MLNSFQMKLNKWNRRENLFNLTWRYISFIYKRSSDFLTVRVIFLTISGTNNTYLVQTLITHYNNRLKIMTQWQYRLRYLHFHYWFLRFRHRAANSWMTKETRVNGNINDRPIKPHNEKMSHWPKAFQIVQVKFISLWTNL